jgi:hypothetical protein
VANLLDFLERLGVELGVDLEAGRLVILDVPGAVHGEEIRAAIMADSAAIYIALVNTLPPDRKAGFPQLVLGPVDGHEYPAHVADGEFRGIAVRRDLWAVYQFQGDRGVFKGWTDTAASARAGRWDGKEDG